MQGLNQLIHSSLQKKSRLLSSYTRELYKIIPSDLRGQCSVLNLEESQITIGIQSAHLTNQIRFYKDDILKQFSIKTRRPVSQLTIKLNPIYEAAKPAPKIRSKISPKSAKTLSSLADSVSSTSLKEALKKLSSRQ